MSDLVSRLRQNLLNMDFTERCALVKEAADRIQTLERELAESAEAKMVKAQREADKWANAAATAESVAVKTHLEAEKAREELEEAQQRIFDLEQAATDPEYAKRNPLGGPARMFDVIADRIRAGEDYHAVLKDYGLDVEAQRDAGRYRLIRDNFPSLLLWDGWPTRLPDGALTAEFVDAAVDDLAKAMGA